MSGFFHEHCRESRELAAASWWFTNRAFGPAACEHAAEDVPQSGEIQTVRWGENKIILEDLWHNESVGDVQHMHLGAVVIEHDFCLTA